jgi:5-methylcytosine-specific restriction endonuclease McrA
MNEAPPAVVTRKEAKAAKAIRYFTGNACKQGHTAERYTRTARCVICDKAATTRWLTDRPTYKLDKSKEWYWKHQRTVLERLRAAYPRRRVAVIAKLSAVRSADRKAYAATMREWRAKNPERARMISRISNNARRAGSPDTVSAAVVTALLKAQRRRCAWCSEPLGRRWHIDHVMPLSRGGEHAPRNLVVACPTCNVRKSAKDPIDWARSLGKLL